MTSIGNSVSGLNAVVERFFQQQKIPSSLEVSHSIAVKKLPLVSTTIAHMRNADGSSVNVTVANVYELALKTLSKSVRTQLAKLALESKEWNATEGDKTSTTTVNGKVCLLSKRTTLQNLLLLNVS